MADTWRVKAWETVVTSAERLASSRRLASEVKHRWQAGEQADAVSFLDRHPHLREDKSIVLDLAVEEFHQRLQNGEVLDPREFSLRFGGFQASINRIVLAERYFVDQPELLGDDEPPWPEAPAEFLGFELLDELGRGGFARVYLATQPDLGDRRVALKVCPKGSDEAHCLGKLRHPNIVPVHSTQQDPETGLTAICMPYLGRATLCDVLDRAFCASGFPTEASLILDAARARDEPNPDEPIDRWLSHGTYIDGVLRLGQQLASALHATHQAGLLHIDLKPSNVLLTPNGRPMLLDFNLSLEQDAVPIRIGGTLPYMSPEQIRASVLGDFHSRVDGRSDVFSLGVILYELLVGALPFGSVRWTPSLHKVGAEWLEAQLRGPRSLRTCNALIDASLARVIERCLAIDPAARWQTAGELAEQLGRQLNRVSRVRRWLRSHRRPVYVGVLVTAALAGTVAGYSYSRDPYWVRQLHAAQASFETRDYADAIERLSTALKDHPNDSRMLILRGRSYEKSERYLEAAQDYRNAWRVVADPELLAREAYCYCLAKVYEGGALHYREAMAHGRRGPRVLHNLGMCYFLQSDLDNADVTFTAALEGDGNLGIAYYGRALAALKRADQGDGMVPGRALTDIKKAIDLVPQFAEVYGIGAVLFAKASAEDPRHLESALQFLEQAAARGLDATRFAHGLKPLANHPRFLELCAHSGSHISPPMPSFLDPDPGK